MRIETHLSNRKLLANAVSEWIHEPVHYNGVPTCSYSVGPVTIDNSCAIICDDADVLATLMPFFEGNGWAEQAQAQMQEHAESLTAEPETATEPAPDSTASEDITGVWVHIPLGDAAPANIVNLLRTLYARQKLINAMIQGDTLFLDEEVVTLLHETPTDTREKICALIDSEASLDMVRGVSVKDDCISLLFPIASGDSERCRTFTRLFAAIVRKAFEAHHVSTTPLDPEDTEMKYFCNSYLIQLGFGGPDNKEDRRILMGHLHGFAAFRNTDKMNAHKTRMSERRRAARQNAEVSADEANR